jgi:carbamoyl-phosphate synthase small subunit
MQQKPSRFRQKKVLSGSEGLTNFLQEKSLEMDPCYLVLEDGDMYPGKAFGYPPPKPHQLSSGEIPKLPVGEVVFNTGMAGYHEILTDPSYSGQIVVMTYPHIGNYGTDEEWNEYGPGDGLRWSRLKATGLVIRSLYDGPIPQGRKKLTDFMEEYKTTGITEVDTRRLTLKIRSGGSPIGVIVTPSRGGDLNEEERKTCLEYLSAYPRMEGSDLVSGLGTAKTVTVNEGGSPHICVVDCGVKANIIRDLAGLGCRVSVVPNRISSQDILSADPNAVLLANGPGDPAVLSHLVNLTKDLLKEKPVFGICLGHQIISLALGARTFKMKFGHHGVNNPVRDEDTGIILITSQNHGFCVEETTLPSDCHIWFRNANDRTIEGISHKRLPVMTAQFHPEAAPGPRDSHWIFGRFLERI